MLETVLLDRALCLPAVDIAALLKGQLVAVLPRVPVQTGWTFALYPYVEKAPSLEKIYHSRFLPLAKTTLAQSSAIEAWAMCEQCMMLHSLEQVEALSQLAIWQKDTLKRELEQRQHLFLAFLRVYRTPELITVSCKGLSPDKFGKFIGLSGLDKQLNQPVKISNKLPVLDDRAFAQRKHQLENLEPPAHPEIEALYDAIVQFPTTTPKAIHLEQDLKYFLGWAESAIVSKSNLDTNWIKEITQMGNSSDGDRFEKLVRKSFIKLGFSNSLNNAKASLDPTASGGAGGIDIYCEAPYALVGECKASKHESVPNSVSAQLIHLGTTHLGRVRFEQSIKVLFVAGRLTDPAEKAAVENQMNVMRPETLERLITLKAKHPGVINLYDLKACLETPPFGEASDKKVNLYIDRSWQQITLRSHIVQQVKLYLESAKLNAAEISALHAVYTFSSPPQSLSLEELHSILIELSSPLTEGYLGRIKGNDWKSDRFYFLRPLNLDPEL
ncbi:MAG TPA: DUF1802 family protein [Leptolyngbya sp.]|nr:DUF1802 family protein [Leptolyngbya sp.]